MKNRMTPLISSDAQMLNGLNLPQAGFGARYKSYLACQYVINQLIAAIKKDKIKKDTALDHIKYILQYITDVKMLENHLVNMEEVAKHEENNAMQELMKYLIFQVKNIDILFAINESQIIQNDIGKDILLNGKPRKSSRQYRDYLLNNPNPYNNPADPDHKMLLTALSRIGYENDLSIIYVEGGSSNPYGHSVLKLGAYGYVHVNTLYGEPQYIPDDRHFAAYCAAQGGHVIGIQPLYLPRHEEAKVIFKKQCVEPWLWQMTHHNCLSFIHKIAIAGGASLEELGYKNSNIHSPEKFPKLFMNNAKEAKRTYGLGEHKINPILLLSEVDKKFDFYFVIDSKLTKDNRRKAVDYYVFLSNKGLKPEDVLDYVSLAYNLSIRSSFLKTISSKVKTVCKVPKAIMHNTKAIGSVAVTGLFGKKDSVVMEEKSINKPQLTRSHSFKR